MSKHLAPVQRDAQNRSVRTLLQGLGVDVLVAAAAWLLTVVGTIDLTDEQALQAAGLLLVKTVLTAVASYVMRTFVDQSPIPTPLPPADPGEPDDEGAIDLRDVLLVAVIVVLVLLIVAIF